MSNMEPLKELTNLTDLNLNADKIEDYSPVSAYCKNLGKTDIMNTDISSKQMPISASNPIADITVVPFSDGNLEKLIRDTIQHPTEDILKGDVDNITTLQNIQDQHIINPSGIETSTESNLDTISLVK